MAELSSAEAAALAFASGVGLGGSFSAPLPQILAPSAAPFPVHIQVPNVGYQ
jgi:hypothetical protein